MNRKYLCQNSSQASANHIARYDIDSSDTACWCPDGIHSWVADQSCNQMNHSWQNRFQFCREKAQPTEPTQCKCVMYTCECGKLLDMVMAIHDLCVLGTPRQRRSMLSSSYPLKDQSYDFMHAGSCAAKQVAQRRPCSMLQNGNPKRSCLWPLGSHQACMRVEDQRLTHQPQRQYLRAVFENQRLPEIYQEKIFKSLSSLPPEEQKKVCCVPPSPADPTFVPSSHLHKHNWMTPSRLDKEQARATSNMCRCQAQG